MATYNYNVMFREVKCCKDKRYFSSLEMIYFTRGYLNCKIYKTFIFTNQECQQVHKYTQITLNNTD